ncbi:DUF6591 domain-containing protein [uncultured Acetobacteroides sp.]|uniref:DUF6591 domain-containing protein n=1 Tax=uncultured Acetobacteroides sp. TaxID=1760811 RepID=UPI0029F4CEB0|nr:DUF6591 domain-containing protein [uncultured Acetobacteroides sp.]
MKKITFVALVFSAVLLATSCGSKETKGSTDSTTTTELTGKETTTETASSENWDDVLNSYEEYIDQYIKLMKKANTGDMSAVSEYPAMMDKANELGEKLQNASTTLTSEQMSRFAKLQTKLTNAATEMMK